MARKQARVAAMQLIYEQMEGGDGGEETLRGLIGFAPAGPGLAGEEEAPEEERPVQDAPAEEEAPALDPAYEEDRANSAREGIPDLNIGENFDVMEDIARRVPLSRVRRPAWDLQQFSSLGLSSEADEDIWQTVWSEEEKLNFASTPMFMIRGQLL